MFGSRSLILFSPSDTSFAILTKAKWPLSARISLCGAELAAHKRLSDVADAKAAAGR
jgi:hypothetical protein